MSELHVVGMNDEQTVCEVWPVGAFAWFEYHCWESPESADAPAWYRSHQRVEVLACHENDGAGLTRDYYRAGNSAGETSTAVGYYSSAKSIGVKVLHYLARCCRV